MSLMTAGNLSHLYKSTRKMKMSYSIQAYRMLIDATELKRKTVKHTNMIENLKLSFIYSNLS